MSKDLLGKIPWFASEDEHILAANPLLDPEERLKMVRNLLGYTTDTQIGFNLSSCEEKVDNEALRGFDKIWKDDKPILLPDAH